jgi:hypothetical protein
VTSPTEKLKVSYKTHDSINRQELQLHSIIEVVPVREEKVGERINNRGRRSSRPLREEKVGESQRERSKNDDNG